MVNDPADAGIFVRSPFRSVAVEGKAEVVGYEAQVEARSGLPVPTGSLSKFEATNPADVRGWTIFQRAPAGLHRAGEWVTLGITARGNRLRTSLDGRPVADVVDPDRTFARGHVALQVHQPGTVLRCRKIEVRELVAAPPRAVAPFDAAKVK
jgi:hypothetical protein